MAKIYIGTSGWSYPKGEGTWKGYFYPPGKIDELVYYSQFFNTVEVNSSFYQPPNPAFCSNWCRKVPDGFLFAMKLWQKFTHPKMYQEVAGTDEVVISRADIDLVKSGIEPLARTGKLGPLLAQFPPSFINNDFNRQILQAIFNSFKEYPLAVEIRHKSWSDDTNTAELFRAYRVSWVQIDEPKFNFSIPQELPLTSDMAYFRFHGRNYENWWTGTTETRYQYLYSPEELIELMNRVKKAAENTATLFAFFNNHWKAYAPKNAADMKKALQLMLIE